MCPPFHLSPDTKKDDMHEYPLDLSATDQAKVFKELAQQLQDVGEQDRCW